MNAIANKLDHTKLPARHKKQLVILILAMLAGAVVLLWGWNILAVDLAGLPRVQFKHAAAFVLSVASAIWIAQAVLQTLSRR